MSVLLESWCFCKGVGKSERMKAAIFTGKGPAMACICRAGREICGTGFLIHRNLLLTTHLNIPSVAAAERLEIRLDDGVAATLVPHRFFISSSVLDLTIVGLDSVDGDSNAQGQQPHYLKICSKPNMDLGSVIYLLGYTAKRELIVGEGKVVIATDNLIKLSTNGITWSPGSAGFDVHGNLAFMICDPMKLATSPNTKSYSTSSSSSSSIKNDSPMQFGIPIPIICDWLNQHWEGSLDELTKPKLALIRLVSTGQKSDHKCASFTLRHVFKPTINDNGAPCLSNNILKARNELGLSCPSSANNVGQEANDPHVSLVQGIPTPEIFESPKLTAVPVRKKENANVQLLDINFPPKATVLPQLVKQMPSVSGECVGILPLESPFQEGDQTNDREPAGLAVDAEIASTGSVNGAQSEVNSSYSPVEVSEMRNGYSSDGETTMYSAETAESRNYTSPRKEKPSKKVGRSQSCVSYNRGGVVHRNPMPCRHMLEQRRSFIHGSRMYSPGATSQRSNDYFSPTVSSVMKNRNNLERPTKTQLPSRTRQHSAVHLSPRWMF